MYVENATNDKDNITTEEKMSRKNYLENSNSSDNSNSNTKNTNTNTVKFNSKISTDFYRGRKKGISNYKKGEDVVSLQEKR